MRLTVSLRPLAPFVARLRPIALLPYALLSAAACGGAVPAAIPPSLDLPVPPEESHADRRADCPKHPAIPPAPKASDSTTRPQIVRFPVTPAAQAIVDAPDRPENDKKLDGGRHPAELLSFLDIKQGMRIAEFSSGVGYTTELLARAVGPKGKIWGENNGFVMKFAEKPWGERLARPSMANVIRVDRELDAPLPPEAKNLDAVVCVLFYHDTVWLGVDRDKMNKAAFDALKKGGEYVIVDHSAVPGRATADVKTLHRISELSVIHEVERAGFHHVTTADFLRNPTDERDWSDSPRDAGERRGTSDRFVLKFVKP
jgi:predicted methyltransferase